jgi:hypothetical protein
LYGGTAAAVELGDTWSWDGATWVQVSDIGPPSRQKAAMVNDGPNTILFGGVAALVKDPPNRVVYGDTWRWDGARWTQLQDIGPSARFGHAMALGPNFQSIALFGGSSRLVVLAGEITSGQSLLGDTWAHAFRQDEQPSPPGSEVTSLSWENSVSTINPTFNLYAQVQLRGTVVQPTAVEFSVFSGSSAAGAPVPPDVIDVVPPSVPIAPGSVSASTIVRPGTSGAPKGVYTLGAIVVHGAVLKTTTFTVA